MKRVRHVLSIITVAALVATTLPAHADLPLLRDNYYEVGPTYQLGGFAFGGRDLGATGIRIYERNGFFGKAIWTIAIAAAMALGQSDSVYLGSEYGPGYRIDYYRAKTADELAADEAARDAAVEGAASNEYQTDLQIFVPQEGLGQAKGYIFSTYPFSWNLGESMTIDLGFVFAGVTGPCGPGKNGGRGTCHYENIGMPLRVSFDLWDIALLDFQVDVNFLGLFGDEDPNMSYAHPVRAGLTFHPWQRLFVRGGVTVPSFDFDELGLQLEAGIRF